jgi:predicted nuclease of restriction endonuclease-like RecB superfamily
MLTADLAISFQRGDNVHPRRMEPDEASLQVAEDLIGIFAEHLHRRRSELDAELNEYVGTGTDYRILRGLIKLLLDACEFETGGAIEPGELRQQLFLKAKEHHPVTPAIRQQLIAELATELAVEHETIVDGLYADLSENQRLISFEAPAPAGLIAQYNLAQAQALLYRCVEMRLTIAPQDVAGYRRLFAALKRYNLIHTIKGSAATGYLVTVSGPLSLFHRSQKYGVRMAVFLPALLECSGWRLRAEIEGKRGKAFYELSSEQQTLLPRDAFNCMESANQSETLDKFLTAWARLQSEWQASVSTEVIDLGGTAFVPDVVLENANGRRVFVELFGFWTPRYLQDRLAEFERGGFRNFVFLVSEELCGSRELPSSLPPNVVSYKTSPDVRGALAAIETLG